MSKAAMLLASIISPEAISSGICVKGTRISSILSVLKRKIKKWDFPLKA